MAQGVQSVETGIQVLKVLQREVQPIALKDLAAKVSMTPSKTRMYLVSLLRTGMVVQTPASAYTLGPAAVSLGMAAFQQVDLVERARELMTAISNQVQGPTLLAMWSGASIMIVNRHDKNSELPFDFRIGGNVSLARTATGRVFLAYLPEEETAVALQRERSPRRGLSGGQVAVESKAALKKDIEQIRSQGYAMTRDVVLTSDPAVRLHGYSALAVPVMDLFGSLQFVLTVIFRAHDDEWIESETQRLLAEIRNLMPGPLQDAAPG